MISKQSLLDHNSLTLGCTLTMLSGLAPRKGFVFEIIRPLEIKLHDYVYLTQVCSRLFWHSLFVSKLVVLLVSLSFSPLILPEWLNVLVYMVFYLKGDVGHAQCTGKTYILNSFVLFSRDL